MKSITKSALIAIAALTVFSCDTPFWEQDGMFTAIEKEIKLEEGVVLGNVYSIIEYAGGLYAGAGEIYKKDPSRQRGWDDFSKPGGKPERVVRLAAGYHNSKEYLYALTAETDAESKTTYRLYCYDGSSWQKLDTKDAAKITVFGNNAVSTGTGGSASNNRAFYNDGNSVRELQGINLVTVGGNTGNTPSSSTISAAFLTSGTTYFSDSAAFCSDGTNLYEANDTAIKNGTTVAALGSWVSDISGNILSLWATASYVYIGTERGAVVRYTSSGAPSPLPGDNADAAIGSYQIISIFAGETAVSGGRAIYAGAVGKDLHQGSKNNGLWGYYDARGNWNKE